MRRQTRTRSARLRLRKRNQKRNRNMDVCSGAVGDILLRRQFQRPWRICEEGKTCCRLFVRRKVFAAGQTRLGSSRLDVRGVSSTRKARKGNRRRWEWRDEMDTICEKSRICFSSSTLYQMTAVSNLSNGRFGIDHAFNRFHPNHSLT